MSVTKPLDKDTRREVVGVLSSLGLTPRDIATSTHTHVSTVLMDMKSIDEKAKRVVKRSDTFIQALTEWLSLHNIDRELERYPGGNGKELALATRDALGEYVDARRINGVIDAVIKMVEFQMRPIDPIEYQGYRRLLIAAFPQRFYRGISRSEFLTYFNLHLVENALASNLTRESLPAIMARWALENYSGGFRAPLDENVVTRFDKALEILGDEQLGEVLSLLYGLGRDRVSYREASEILNLTCKKVRRLEWIAIGLLRTERVTETLSTYLKSPLKLGLVVVMNEYAPLPSLPRPQFEVVLNKPASPSPSNAQQVWSLCTPIEQFPLSARAYNYIKNLGVKSVLDFIQIPEEAVRNGINKNEFEKIKDKLGTLGFSFGMTVDGNILRNAAGDMVTVVLR
jgi:hypothetical protein